MVDAQQIQLEEGWKAQLLDQFEADYMKQLKQFLMVEKQSNKIIYPKGNAYFNALNLTPFEQVRVVILGQDPYHGPDQAHGLCFSVQDGVALPPSLKNIYKEMESDLGLPIPNHGNLTHWAEQGVLLLNSVLTVEQGKAASHQGKGWERFTDQIIECINRREKGVVFMLWGAYAQKKGQLIDAEKHCVLKAPHPSPLSAHRGFFGCHHFSKANQWLAAHGQAAIDWQLNR